MLRQGRILELEYQGLEENLALEHAIILKHEDLDYQTTVRFWRNPKSVILGRSQDICEEVNITYCQEHRIKLGRRISGGGAVFHDKGNLNISFFVPKYLFALKNINFPQINSFFTNMLIQSLESIFRKGRFARLNNASILFDDKKVSGSAGYLRGNWFLHHATLLLDVNLHDLENSLLAGSSSYSSRRKSEYYPTTNLPSFDLGEWKKSIIKRLEKSLNIQFDNGEISPIEEVQMRNLASELYAKDSWLWDKKRN